MRTIAGARRHPLRIPPPLTPGSFGLLPVQLTPILRKRFLTHLDALTFNPAPPPRVLSGSPLIVASGFVGHT